MTNSLPSQDRLLSLFEYRPDTGELVWRQQSTASMNEALVGRLAPWRQVGVDGTKYKTSRVIWKMQTDEEPPIVDHWDGDPTNNRWPNLRAADSCQNKANSSLPVGVSGHRGVWSLKRQGRVVYQAGISVLGRSKHLGVFERLEDAVAARREAEDKFQGEFAMRRRH